ncbi:hypothetical protein [Streptomyces californicus]
MSKPNRKVIRLQQRRAQQSQAGGIKHVDVVYEVPGDEPGSVREKICSFLTQDYWPVKVVRATQGDGNAEQLEALRKVASPPENFDELIDIAELTFAELKDLIDDIQQEAGTDEGEGSGSSSSSTSTQEPSAPTSSGTTPAAA